MGYKKELQNNNLDLADVLNRLKTLAVGVYEMDTTKHTVVYPKSYAFPPRDYAFGSGSFSLNHTEVTTNDVE